MKDKRTLNKHSMNQSHYNSYFETTRLNTYFNDFHWPRLSRVDKSFVDKYWKIFSNIYGSRWSRFKNHSPFLSMRIIRNWSHTNRGPTMSQLELWCTARPNSEQPPRKQYPSHSHCIIVDMSHDTWWLTVHDFHYFRFSNVGAFELICTGHTYII